MTPTGWLSSCQLCKPRLFLSAEVAGHYKWGGNEKEVINCWIEWVRHRETQYCWSWCLVKSESRHFSHGGWVGKGRLDNLQSLKERDKSDRTEIPRRVKWSSGLAPDPQTVRDVETLFIITWNVVCMSLIPLNVSHSASWSQNQTFRRNSVHFKADLTLSCYAALTDTRGSWVWLKQRYTIAIKFTELSPAALTCQYSAWYIVLASYSFLLGEMGE